MNNEISLDNLEKRNCVLKSQLIHEQLKYGNYSSQYFKRYGLTVLNEYKTHGSFFKAASIIGIPQRVIMTWYIQGQRGDPEFRNFYLAIEDINRQNQKDDGAENDISDVKMDFKQDGEYIISEYGDGWSYKTYIDGEKIFIISNELETLKMKVRNKRLPLD